MSTRTGMRDYTVNWFVSPAEIATITVFQLMIKEEIADEAQQNTELTEDNYSKLKCKKTLLLFFVMIYILQCPHTYVHQLLYLFCV